MRRPFLAALLGFALAFGATGAACAQTVATFGEKSIGTSTCTNGNASADFDTLAQCTSTGATTGAMQKAPLFVGAVTSPPYASTGCDSTKAGMLQYTASSMQFCNGTTWTTIFGGVPTGTIAVFESTTCPAGWNEYTPARGRFLRGIDNGAGNDPSGTRAPGNVQLDAFQGHTFNISPNSVGTPYPSGGLQSSGGGAAFATPSLSGPVSDGSNGTPRTSSETRPQNVAVIFCQYAGISSSSGVTAVGTANYVAKWTSSTAIGIGLLYDTGSSVGIGTTTPAAALDVNGSVRPGNSGVATASACSPEGALAYDVAAHSPVFCSNSGLWTGYLGISQTWQNVGSSRVINTAYTNSSGRPIEISVEFCQTGSSQNSAITVGGVTVVGNVGIQNINSGFQLTAIVPPGQTYSVSGGNNICYWAELR
jgi:hypothetical protein